ncbi:MAG: DUF1320 domain-containing protein [Candidatus Gastranaerophilales bacterium]|nr:DUF1320 domain-containing protein [Candidatus Gastranaerophilales bacterium]
MSYSTLENLEAVIPEQELINLTSDTAPPLEIDTDKINAALSFADEMINAYLRNKYILPLTYIPLIIVQIATDIAAYRLYSRRPKKLPEHIKEGYESAIKTLSAIQKEQMILDLPAEHPDEDVTSPAKMVVTNKTTSSRIFSDEMLKGFRL